MINDDEIVSVVSGNYERDTVAVSGIFPFPACLVRHSQGRHIHYD
jgi:hypothetical protein